MAKKAKKVSWRTIARRAEKAADLPKARRLRAESAALRRADRAAKKTKKAAPAARRGLAALAAKAPATPEGINREPTTAWQATAFGISDKVDRGLPGQGDVVGGEISKLADELAKMARKKGGTDAIQNKLLAIRATAHYEGCVEADTAGTKRLVEVQQIMADRIVCGFLAEMEHTMNFHRGFPPGMVHVIDAFTITKIIDALNKAGYRSTGKT